MMGQSHRPLVAESVTEARWKLVAIAVLLAGGVIVSWYLGRDAGRPIASGSATRLAGDLALYRDIVAQVRSGRDYYQAAHELLPHYGFPISSPLNWRLPTYAWLFSKAEDIRWVRVPLVVLAGLALILAGVTQWRADRSMLKTGTLVLLCGGVVSWAVDGQAYLAQEPWVAALLLLSVSAFQWAGGWMYVAAITALGALFLRELVLPYCVVACAITILRRDWRPACLWGVGILAFVSFFGWHVMRIRHELAGDMPVGPDFGQWVRFGGLEFVLRTLRMNQLLFTAPGWLVWGYLVSALVGLSASERCRLPCLSLVVYLLLFAVLGRPENAYWGLLTAPLLPWGVVLAPEILWRTWRIAVGVS